MRKVGIIQSSYIPWKGYFDIINDVDVFVFYDDVQYTKNDWRNRNKLKTDQGTSWITIPVGKRIDRLIYEVEIHDNSWQKKHWNTIKGSYSRTPYFKQYQEFFEYVYLETEWTKLSTLNHFLLEKISKDYLGIQTEFRDSRKYDAQGEKLERLVDLLIKVEATSYISGPSARRYIDENRFRDAGIELIYKDYTGYPEYTQLFPPFEHAVSILDLLFNCGPAAPDYIWGWREGNILDNQ
jgi:hypothetical protein